MNTDDACQHWWERVERHGGISVSCPRSYGWNRSAVGVYTVCDGTFCNDNRAYGSGLGNSEYTAGVAAEVNCTMWMYQSISTETFGGNHAYTKETCKVDRCFIY